MVPLVALGGAEDGAALPTSMVLQGLKLGKLGGREKRPGVSG